MGKQLKSDEIEKLIEDAKNENLEEQKIRQIEKIADQCLTLSIAAAMEAGRFESIGISLTTVAADIKFLAETLQGIVMQRKYKQPDFYLFLGKSYGGDEKVAGEQIDNFAKSVLSIADLLENSAIKGVIEGYRFQNLPFNICIEEVRQLSNKLQSIVSEEGETKRRVWINTEVEEEELPYCQKPLQMLSFDIGGIEIIEEFGYIDNIINYSLHEKDISNNKLTLHSKHEFSVIEYFDSYKKFNLQMPKNKDLIKIVILKIPFKAEGSKVITSHGGIAFPVDCINYPFKTKIGKRVEPETKQINGDFIRSCWNAQCGNETWTSHGKKWKLKHKQFLFLDWNKLKGMDKVELTLNVSKNTFKA